MAADTCAADHSSESAARRSAGSWFKQDVAVREQDQRLSRHLRTHMHRMILAQPSVRQFGDVDHFQSRIRRRHFVHDATCGIGGAIIHGDQFQRQSFRLEQRRQRVADLSFFVPRGDNNADTGQLRSVRVFGNVHQPFPCQRNDRGNGCEGDANKDDPASPEHGLIFRNAGRRSDRSTVHEHAPARERLRQSFYIEAFTFRTLGY